jgi:hypothetical protein
LLLLDSPICVAQADDINEAERDQLLVQLNAGPEKFGSEQQLSGKRVQARGTLYHAHTAHHHTPLILTVESLTIERGRDADK